MVRMPRTPVTADDVVASTHAVLTAFRRHADADWTVPAGSLEWTCFETAEHIAEVGLVYGAQLALAKQEPRYVRLFPRKLPEVIPDEVMESIAAAFRILELTTRASGPEVRVYHPYGMADAEGYAAMGCAELLNHGHDVVTGLGGTFAPPAEICDRVTARLFPDLPTTDGVDPWARLLAATGRATLPRQGGSQSWRYQPAPPVEGDVTS